MIKTFLFLTLTFFALQVFSQENQWLTKVGGTSGWVIVDDDGNIYTAGSFTQSKDFDPGPQAVQLTSKGGADVFISKTDRNGNFLWAKSIGTINDDYGTLAVDHEGNIIIAGDFIGQLDTDPGEGSNILTGYYDVFILKLDKDGNFIWSESVGGDSYDNAGALTVDALNNIYVTGRTAGGDFDPGAGELFLYQTGFTLKLNSDGDFAWAKAAGGNDIQVDNSDNVILVGQFSYSWDFDPGIESFPITSAGKSDGFISKLTSNGDFVWAKSIGGPGEDVATSLSVDKEGNFLVAGSFAGVCDFDPGEQVHDVVTNGYQDGFVVKLDPEGGFLWVNQMGGSDNDAYNSIGTDAEGNVFASGIFQAVADVYSTARSLRLVAKAGYDLLMVGFSPSGKLQWSSQVGGYSDDTGVLSTDRSGGVYITGNSYPGLVQGPGFSGQQYNALTGDSYLLKLVLIVTGIDENNSTTPVVYPNPVVSDIYVSDDRLSFGSLYTITELSGRTIKKGKVDSGNARVDVADLKPGLYIITIDQENPIQIKFLKQ